MKYLTLFLALSFFVHAGLQAQSALSSLRNNPPTSSSSAKPKHTNKKKGLGDHHKPDKVEDVRVGQAFAAYESGDENTAKNIFDQLDGQDPDAAFGLGLALYEDGQIDEAVTALNKAIQLDGAHTDALYLLGLIYAEGGNYPASADYLLRLLDIDETDADAWYLLGFLFYHSGDAEDAEVCLEQARQYDDYYNGEVY